jgi:AraC-like DNA-binding protein
MKIYVKYMVSHRCKLMVMSELERLGIKFFGVELGIISLAVYLTDEQSEQLNKRLKKSGLELLDDRRGILVESIKLAILEMIHYSDEEPIYNYSDYLSEKLGYDYTYLANVFTEVKGMTIQHFIILNKIEKAKELILYDELTLSEIAYRLHYSSTAHLSHQFKKVTGLTCSFFKEIANRRRSNLEDI